MVMNGRSALELAAQTGDSRMVRLLLSHGAVPGNALMAAVVGGHIDTLDLIAHAQPKPTRNQRAYAIEEATREGKMDFVRILNKSAEAPDSTSRSGHAPK
jgi:ankyrin repeat protein